MAGDVDELTFADVEIHVFQRMRMGAGVGLGDLLEPDHLSVMLLRTGVTFVKAAGRRGAAGAPRRPPPAGPPRRRPSPPRRLRPCLSGPPPSRRWPWRPGRPRATP